MSNCVFLLEAIAYRVTLTDPDPVADACPVCVCFRFPGLVDLDVCEGAVCGTDGDGDEVHMTRGKSCLFAVDARDLCRVAREFCDCCTVHAYRVVEDDGGGAPVARPIGLARLEFDRTFEELVLDPNRSDRTRELTTTLPLFEDGRKKPVGMVEIYVRLTSQGKILVTQFSKPKDGDKYQFKGLKEFVPTDVQGPVKCTKCRRRRRHANNNCCARNRKPPCGKDAAQASEKVDDAGGCVKQLDRLECILSAMEQIKQLYVEASSYKGQPGLREECVFDANCPVAGCPFKMECKPEVQIAAVDRNARKTRKGPNAERDGQNEAQRADAAMSSEKEIEDDADLFVVRVGRVDPCRKDVLEHRDRGTLTDFPEEALPPPSLPDTKTKSSKQRQKRKTSKGKKEKKK